MRPNRSLRSRSPFRALRSRSKSPFGRRPLLSKSPLQQRSDLDESEINIFQQLCLDRHDDSAAIEILLEAPDLQTAPYGNTHRSSRALSKETPPPPTGRRKKTFLKRFFKTPRKNISLDPSRSNGIFDKSGRPKSSEKLPKSSEQSDGKKYAPTPPSSVSEARVSGDSRGPVPPSNSTSSERFDTFSNMSSLSGTKVSTLKTPHQFDRHETLGNDSIKDIRSTLKEMEKQLGHDSNRGRSISRQKVMRALVNVADSLDDKEEREVIRHLMRKERAQSQQLYRPLSVVSSDDDESDTTSSNDDEYDSDLSTNSEDESSYTTSSDSDDDYTSVFDDCNLTIFGDAKENIPFNLFASVGELFKITEEDKEAVESALDDLLWTEFVSSRKSRTSSQSKKRGEGADRVNSRKNQKRTENFQAQFEEDFSSYAYDNSTEQKKELKSHKQKEPTQAQRPRSWWRPHPKSPVRDKTIFEEDKESLSSEKFADYLPVSITVRTTTPPRVKAQQNHLFFSSNNQRCRVNMIDSESCLDYVMGSAVNSIRLEE